jgi:hypothetical protein
MYRYLIETDVSSGWQAPELYKAHHTKVVDIYHQIGCILDRLTRRKKIVAIIQPDMIYILPGITGHGSAAG